MATTSASPRPFAGCEMLFRPTDSSIAASPAAFAGVAKPVSRGNPNAANDRLRSWLWSFLAVAAASQLYFFRELFAAFAFFVGIFAVFTFAVLSLYMLVKCGEQAAASLARLRQPAIRVSRLADDLRKTA